MKPLERSVLESLFREHAAGLAGAVRGVLGPEREGSGGSSLEEVLQEAFLKALRGRDAATARRGVRDPVAWVFVLTMNVARDHRRRLMRRRSNLPVEEVDPVSVHTAERGPVEQLARQEFLVAARREIVELREPEKEVFLLRASGGCTFEGIADELGIPVGTAKSRMRSALRVLRERLASHRPEASLPTRGSSS